MIQEQIKQIECGRQVKKKGKEEFKLKRKVV